MKLVQLLIRIRDDNTIGDITISINTTGLPSDKKLLQGIANAILTDKGMDEAVEIANNILNNESDGG